MFSAFLRFLSMLCVVVGAAAGPLLAQAQPTGGSCTGFNASAHYIQGLTLDGPTPADWTPSAMHWHTGLVWQRCVQGKAFNPDTGRCEGAATAKAWLAWAETDGLLPLSFSGQQDWNIDASFSSNLLRSGGWRLPYKSELLPLHTDCPYSSVTNEELFPDTPAGFFWTASPDVPPHALQLSVDPNASPAVTAAAASTLLPVRLVRSGQPFAALSQSDYVTNGNADQVTAFAPIKLAPSSGGTDPESIAWGGVRIAGGGSPQLRVNDWGDWVTEAIVRSGDEITVRLTAPNTPGTRAGATLTLRSGQTTGTSSGAGNGGNEGTALQEISTRFHVISVAAPASQACAHQRVLYVEPNGTSIGSAGSSWSSPASLQHALGIANADTDLTACYAIHLKQGIYKPGLAGNVSAHFAINRPLQLLGGYVGDAANTREINANNTVLSGDIDNNDEGVGSAQGITEVARFHADGTPAAGNQLRGDNSTRVLVIGGPDTTLGNGVYSAHPSEASYTVLEGLSLTGGGGDEWGGGLFCNGAGAGRQCSPLLRQLRLSGNRAHIGGGLYNNGQEGGVSSPQMDSVTFSGNWAGFGGAMANDGQSGTSSPTIVNTTFSGNHADYGGGGAMDNNDYLGVSSPRIHHSTFSGNQAVEGSAIQGGAPVVSASIFWGNVGALFESIKGTSSFTNSIVQGGRAGAGNLNIDPLLWPLQDNGGATQTLMPGAGSPAIDALACTSAPSTDQRGTTRPQGYGCDIGAVEAPASSYTAPSAPTGVSASAGNGSALVQWSAPASNGGGAITGYTVTSSGGQTCTATPPATSCTVTGLSNGTAYTFTVVARNGAGAGAASSASSDITPAAPASLAIVSTAPAAGQVTAVLTADAPATGHLTVLQGSGAQCGTPAQVQAGQDATGAPAYRRGALALAANTPGRYTVRNLAHQSSYTLCASADTGTAVASASFSTPAMAAFANASWAMLGGSVSAEVGDRSSLAFAPDGTPYVAYRDGANSNKATVKRWNGSAWEPVGNARFSAGEVYEISLAFAPDGTPHVAYPDGAYDSKATAMRWSGSAWELVGSAGFSAGMASDVSLAFAPDGMPHVAYQDAGNGNKATAMRWDGSTWQAVGNAGFSQGKAFGVSLAFAPDGMPHVAYTDEADGSRATVMRWSGSAWQAVGSTGFSAGAVYEVSLALAPDGTPHVAYRDKASGDKATVMRWGDLPVTPPGTPTGVTAVAGNGQATVSFTAPTDTGGGAPTGYTVTALPGGQTCTAAPPATSCTVTGLANRTPYTFTVVATNSSGASASSAASAAVTPMAAAIDGVCGSANTVAALAAPSSNLCSVGSASSVTSTAAAFNWNCTGSNGGTTDQCSAPRQYSIAASAQPSAGGSATCAASTVAQGASVTCTATANAGYLFQEWTGACAGQALACSLSNVTAHQTSAALFAQQTTGLTLPEGQESGQSLGLLLQHSAAHWTIGSASTATVAAVVASSGIGLPSNVQLPYGLVSLQLVSGTVGSSASVVLTYPQALPADAKYYKLGKTAANPSPHWYEFSGAVVSGNTVTLTLTDGGAGDNDLNRDGNIDDPGGPAVVRAAPPPPPPPPPPSLVRLQVSISGAGAVQRSVAGSVIGTPGSTTTVEYLEGQSVTLTPQPEAGARFSGWMGACSGLLPCHLTLRSNQAAQATFTSAPAPSSCRSNVFSDDEERLLDAYLAYFGRPADVAGLAYWVAQLAGKGGRLDTIVDGFGNSQEFENRFGHMSAEQLIANLYQQMYGRAPDAQGAVFFMAQLASGQSSLAAIALHIFDGRQGSDRTVADNRKKVARYFVTRFEELGSAAPASLDGDSWSRLLADVGAEEASASAGCAGVDSLLAGPALR